jgi:hypothetical protein
MKKLQEQNPDSLKVVKMEVDANKDIVEQYEVCDCAIHRIFHAGLVGPYGTCEQIFLVFYISTP